MLDADTIPLPDFARRAGISAQTARRHAAAGLLGPVVRQPIPKPWLLETVWLEEHGRLPHGPSLAEEFIAGFNAYLNTLPFDKQPAAIGAMLDKLRSRRAEFCSPQTAAAAAAGAIPDNE